MRINVKKTEPKAYRALFELEKYLDGTGLNPIHKSLIQIRASQINRCAFCLNMHTKDARELGETELRIYMLNAWREAYELFTEEEKVILAMTEEITLINNSGLSDETYKKAISLFSENQVAQLIMAIVTINAWNRINVASEVKPEY